MIPHNLKRPKHIISWIVGLLVWLTAGAFVLAMFLAVVAT